MNRDNYIGLLVSGELGYIVLSYLFNRLEKISFICTDSNSNKILDFVNKNNIDHFIGNPREGRVSNFIKSRNIELLISINYLFLIESDLISLPKQCAINIHGSLLPKYRGRTPHVWAIINNEKVTGITAHLIDLSCDSGSILDQICVEIGINDTGNDLLIKYMDIYPKFVHKIVEKARLGKLIPKIQDEKCATYYGKRNPEDGLINWNWQKERIRNWVRALAYPYPGSFSFCNGIKITIDEIVYHDHGFHYNDPNGLILSTDPLIIKTPNGAIEVTSYREKHVKLFNKKILGV